MAAKDQTIIVPTAAEDQAYQRKLAPVAEDADLGALEE